MKTYVEKLKDPRWFEFRDRALHHHGNACNTCGGEDKKRSDFHHVHHKRYITGREPWEYGMDDVTILCRECHNEIHECEAAWRNLIRSLPSWCMTEFKSLVDAIQELDPHGAQGVAAFAKNRARQEKWKGGQNGR